MHDAVYQVKNCYIHRNIAGNNVLISVGENIANFNGYIELNDSASFLWEQLKEPKSVSELEQALADTFDIARKTAAEDVKDFLGELLEHDMVMQL